jgi:hypothetical protein
MLGISLTAILISTSKNALSFLLLLMSTPQQNWRKGQNRFCLEARGVGGEGVGSSGGKNTHHKNGAGGVDQSEDPEFMPQYHTHKKRIDLQT